MVSSQTRKLTFICTIHYRRRSLKTSIFESDSRSRLAKRLLNRLLMGGFYTGDNDSDWTNKPHTTHCCNALSDCFPTPTALKALL